MSCLKNNLNALAFGAILIVATTVGICSYFGTKSHFTQSCERICAVHEKMCDDVRILVSGARKDSTATVNEDTIVSAIREGNGQIRAMLQLQHAEIEEDFSNLMLWAAVLMVVFLVFSIYSMFKTDNLINEGRSSVGTIKGLYSKAEEKISSLDTMFETESTKLARESQKQIDELRDRASKKLSDFTIEVDKKLGAAEGRINADIAKYNKQVDDKAANVQKQFEEMRDAISLLVKFLRPHPDNAPD